MLDEAAFSDLVKRIMALGYDEETAGDYAALIGDCVGIDENGLTVVEDEDGNIIARLPLKWD